METFWSIFWIVFWIMVFIGLSFFFFYIVKILRDLALIIRTASNVSDQIQAISDIVEDMRTKANMGIFIDVLEMSKRLFLKLKSPSKKTGSD